MADYPALPLWTDAYLSDTRHLTTEEHGAYLLLLMTAWRRPDCDLPNDDAMLARWAGVSPTKWKRIKIPVLAFWSLEKGLLKQKKLSKMREIVSKKVIKNRRNASLGGKAKALKYKETGLANGIAKT